MAKNAEKGNVKKKTIALQSPKGMHDILPDEELWWEFARDTMREVAESYHFSRIDTPLLEEASLFERGVGGATDIVEKQMFYVKTRGVDRLVLRPENTAGIMRAYLEHGMAHLSQPLKLYYFGPMFRYEQPQAGRYRQFHQSGFEMLGGESDALYDAQIMLVTYRFMEALRLKKLVIQLNTIGCRTCRVAYRRKLQEYYRRYEHKLCRDCKRRLEMNPLRLLDCKEEGCVTIRVHAPIMIDHLCASCRNHFKGVLEYLDELALPYALNPYLVRGLDYYNRTVFEVFTEESGFALGGGGRYDYLAEILGGRKTDLPAVGSAPGIERLIDAMKVQAVAPRPRPKGKVFLIQIGDEAKKKSLALIERFRAAHVRVNEALGRGSLKAQLRIADKDGAEVALLFGQREVFEGTIIIRDMKGGAQETVPLEKVVEEVRKRL